MTLGETWKQVEPYIRGRESDRFVYLLATLPLPATREILIGLDDGVQACPRIIALVLDLKCNTPHEIFGRLYAFGGLPRNAQPYTC